MRATCLSVAGYNTTLSSDSLETGTGSSNSLRSAKESVLFTKNLGAAGNSRVTRRCALDANRRARVLCAIRQIPPVFLPAILPGAMIVK